MAPYPIRHHWLLLGLFAAGFMLLLAARLDLIPLVSEKPVASGPDSPSPISEQDTWMQIALNNHKIGYAHSVLSGTGNGFSLKETLFIKFNILGAARELKMSTNADLKPDLSISRFDFRLCSARFDFKAAGAVFPGPKMHLDINVAGSCREMTLDLEKPPYLTAGILYATARNKGLATGQQFSYPIFDPSTMQMQPIKVKVKGIKTLNVMGKKQRTRKLRIDFKGAELTAWISPNGEVVKEKGLLGMTLEKVSRKKALAGLDIAPGQDLTALAAVPVGQKLENPRQISELVVRIKGVSFDGLDLNGQRQTLSGNRLRIKAQNPAHADGRAAIGDTQPFASALSAGPFIQSGHPDIKKLAEKLTAFEGTLLEKTKKLVSWVYENIEKRPVISIPDAHATLKSRMGDCNEHAMLLAALARAAGIPAEIEAGLVYLNGRFYYHAWNRIYVGKWITADAVFGQIPADATHIRLVSGAPERQLDLMPVIGRIQLSILRWE
ncbi:MAG: lasso peptide biosynthesis protein [Desulfobacterales bacterium]|nr:lasso peptide biosynthesis protein [Desulfobacterales bacterium]